MQNNRKDKKEIRITRNNTRIRTIRNTKIKEEEQAIAQ
jgi:hypothetical protein